MAIVQNINEIKEQLPNTCSLVAVSKTKPNSMIEEAYQGGQRVFGENKVQELVQKQEDLPKDIEWHMIGHMQRNKVKYIAPFVALIHGVDTEKLLKEINKQGEKVNRKIRCLLQIHIAEEDTKFGFDTIEIQHLFEKNLAEEYPHVLIKGFMGMATFTEDQNQIRKEFKSLKAIFDQYREHNPTIDTLSMGMSGDWKIAVEEGSTMIRVGSSIFGARNYQ